MASTRRLGVIGLGYMGLASALAFAERGVRVIGYDLRPELRSALRGGRTESVEPRLATILRRHVRTGRLTIVDSLPELLRETEIVFLCLPTPPRRNGQIDLRPLERGCRDLGKALREVAGYRLVVVKSTVVPGTTSGPVREWIRASSGRDDGAFGVASNPEFLAEGSAVADALTPDRVVLGVERPGDRRRLAAVYRGFPGERFWLTPTAAELVKYSSNAFLALKVGFANELSRVAERLAVNIDEVMAATGHDRRIGTAFLSAGPGFGGSCFEKDVRALVRRSAELGINLDIGRALLTSNDRQTDHAVELVALALSDPRPRTIALLGLAFKAGTDDVRESRALPMARALASQGHRVRLHDPMALDRFRELVARWPPALRNRLTFCGQAMDAVRGADLAIVQAGWPEYREWSARWTREMRRPVVLDLRRCLSKGEGTARGLRVFALGDGPSWATLTDRSAVGAGP